MTDLTQKEMVSQLHLVVIGLPDNADDNGLVGDIKEIKQQVTTMNGAVKHNTTWRKVHTWVLGLMVPLIITLIAVSLNAG